MVRIGVGDTVAVDICVREEGGETGNEGKRKRGGEGERKRERRMRRCR